MDKLGTTITIEAKEGTPEFEKEVFSKMRTALDEVTRDFYEKSVITFEVLPLRFGWKNNYAVYKIENLSPRVYTKHKIKAFKTKPEAVMWLFENIEKLNKK